MVCKSVLIVEDDKEIRELIQEALELEGFSTRTATNGKEALEILDEASDPYLILLDLMMPVMNGWQFLEAKKANDSLAPMPVVIISAASNEKIGNGASNANGVIKKPIDLDVLIHWVRKYC